MHYILASGSPRRIQMMREHGLEPVVFPAEIEENIPPFHDMHETVMFLSLKKALWVRENFRLDEIRADTDDASERKDEPFLILAADTIVYHNGEIMGKPVDFDDAFRMLTKIRGTCHYVVTGVSLIDLKTGTGQVFSEVTEVWFKDYSDEELVAYLQTEEAYDKAGAYAIQGYFSRYIDHIDGDYDNVVGFPWSSITKKLGI